MNEISDLEKLKKIQELVDLFKSPETEIEKLIKAINDLSERIQRLEKEVQANKIGGYRELRDLNFKRNDPNNPWNSPWTFDGSRLWVSQSNSN
jgi:chromosome segregation ATPase